MIIGLLGDIDKLSPYLWVVFDILTHPLVYDDMK